ncbi:GAP family protein [Pseudonocardia sp. KRD291]|uniref:GAP family protein n=1 Tax=Pseudonocardia sp. KRD291 TaxID=2792007 RepID=UPI001C49F4B5|nr:GAP family protein [Pseudonocardia sp. KRD291]MBW0102530.1 GAP family protein [Pseudonocardia sp. KRD291]
MSPEALVLGLLSAVRATPLAIVYALLLSPHPRRLVGAYTIAGLAVSLVLGLAAVAVFDGSSQTTEQTTGRYAIDLVLGIGALVYAVGYGTGRFGDRKPAGENKRPVLDGRLGAMLRTPTASAAASAGGVTNLPGLFYIAGLVAILETNPSPVNGVFQVVVYNALRLAMPIAALALVTLRPQGTRDVVEAVRSFGIRNKRVLVTGVLLVVGLYLAVKGLLGLLG